MKRLPHTDPKEVKHNLNEMSFLSFCKHPNIVRYYTSCMLKDELLVLLTMLLLFVISSDLKSLDQIVMEHMEGGTLTEATKGHNFTELQIAFVARELLKGLVRHFAVFIQHAVITQLILSICLRPTFMIIAWLTET